jgi:hypothetical protein
MEGWWFDEVGCAFAEGHCGIGLDLFSNPMVDENNLVGTLLDLA